MEFAFEPPAGPEEQMARDAALLAAGRPFARAYLWDAPAVTLGRFQDPSSALTRQDVPWAIRPTGGGAVLHGTDVTLAIVVPIERRGARELYWRLTRPILAALGPGVRTAEVDERAPTPDCFAGLGPGDLVDASGRKVAGCALRVGRGAALLQASVPYAPLDLPWIVGAAPLAPETFDPAAFVERFARAVLESPP